MLTTPSSTDLVPSSNRMPNELLNVRIVTPRQLIFQAEAYSVSSVNYAGKFDILPGHANFVTIVENKTITVRTNDKRRLIITFPVAIIYNTRNQVNIYTDIPQK